MLETEHISEIMKNLGYIRPAAKLDDFRQMAIDAVAHANGNRPLPSNFQCNGLT
jgi:hypothetical protein